MPLIAVSADIYETGLDIAHQSAEKLGYRFLGRELLAEVAQEHKVTEKELLDSLQASPGLLPRRVRRRRELSNLIQVACLERLQQDNTVCYGLGAHLYLEGVSHAMRVHIISTPQQRAADLARKEGMPLQQAPKLLKRRDQSDHKWSKETYGSDDSEPSLYDLALNLTTLEPAKAVDLICDAAASSKFMAMTYSKQCLQDKLTACRVRQKLLPSFPDVEVSVSNGTVVVRISSLPYNARKKQEKVRQLASEVPGINYVEVHVTSRLLISKRG